VRVGVKFISTINVSAIEKKNTFIICIGELL
jgi:hypothetical protein